MKRLALLPSRKNVLAAVMTTRQHLYSPVNLRKENKIEKWFIEWAQVYCACHSYSVYFSYESKILEFWGQNTGLTSKAELHCNHSPDQIISICLTIILLGRRGLQCEKAVIWNEKNCIRIGLCPILLFLYMQQPQELLWCILWRIQYMEVCTSMQLSESWRTL